MALLDDIFLDELVDDPEPMLIEEPDDAERPITSDNEEEENEQPPLNDSEPTKGAVRVAPKKLGLKRQHLNLDAQKITGARGILSINQHFKNVKLKGKGHELADVNTIMSHLEHWANRMYPRSNFDDVLKKVEGLGTKRPVINLLRKIRLDMVEDVELDTATVSDNEATETMPTSDDIFDELLASQPTSAHAP